jgi:TrmH family RNA methyltransferase
MISKNKLKQIKSLSLKKFRQKEQLFLVEGDKNVLEVLHSPIRVQELYATETFLTAHTGSLSGTEQVNEATQEEIKKASLLKQPQNCLAICEIPPAGELPQKPEGLSLFLDGIQDPGNLGTIIRTCDWFGMEYLFCSPDTADVFNPKVIQASMGSFCRIKTVYTPFDTLAGLFNQTQIPVYGTFLEGKNLYAENFPVSALIVLGNEGRGIRAEIEERIDFKLNIPSFNHNSRRAESLNVAVAAGIICSEFKTHSK